MKKVLTFVLSIIYTTISFGQTSEANYIALLNMSLETRTQYLDTHSSIWIYNNINGYWESDGYRFYKFFKDSDNDNIGDPNNYLAYSLSDFPHNFSTEQNITIFDSVDNSIYREIDYYIHSFNYAGFHWVRLVTYGTYNYPSNIEYITQNSFISILIDCNDSNSNLPTHFERQYKDYDGDGYGNSMGLTKIISYGCNLDPNWVSNIDDCNDYDANIGSNPINWYKDFDNDGYGDINEVINSCEKPFGYVSNSNDCDDTNAMYNNNNITWYADLDNDGFGDPNDTIIASCPPTNYITNCHFDDCPTETGTDGKGCPQRAYDFNNENKNYVYDIIYKEAFESDDLPLASTNDVIQQIIYGDGLGRANQSIGIKQSGSQEIANSELQYDWAVGLNSTPFFNINGSISENLIEYGLTPFGDTDLIWKCGNDVNNNADGGWKTDFFAIDKNTKYRYTTWVKRTGNRLNGKTYHGTHNVDNLDGSPNGNPYFWHGFLPEIDKWYLLVGVIHPYDYTGGDTGESGVYDIDGNKVLDGYDFKWESTATISRFRNYFYYCTDIPSRQYFWNPILQKEGASQWLLEDIINNSQAKDIITHIEYDGNGRKTKDYLPYASSSSYGLFDEDSKINTLSFYNTTKYENTTNPYSEISFDDSPLNKVLETGSPGNSWAVDKNSDNDHTTKLEYNSNTTSDYVKKFSVSFISGNIESPQLVDEGEYQANELYKTVIKDENWQPNQTYPNDHTTEEYIDKFGQVVLKRAFKKGKWHDTYNVYDEFGNLTFVLPPIMNATSLITQQWSGSYSSDIDDFFEGQNDEAYISLYFNLNTGYLSVDIEGYGDGELMDGNVLSLDFINPTLPNIELGELEFDSGDIAADAFINGGFLYFDSSGNDGEMVEASFSIDLSAYQQNFTAPIIDSNQLNELAYQYKYDYKNRLVEKKVPGKDWEYIVYNKLDQVILTQNAKLRSQNKWYFNKFDIYGRNIYSGTYNDSRTRIAVQNSANGIAIQFEQYAPTQSGLFDYTNDAYPTGITNSDVLNLKYYDDYVYWTGDPTIPSNIYGINTNTNVRGLPTTFKTRVLNENNKWVTNIIAYDDKSRPIYTYSKNDYLNTTDILKSKLDFRGKTIETTTEHTKGTNATITTIDKTEYDHVGRILKQTQSINGASTPELISKINYDELGQLLKKDVGNTESQPLQQVDYSYNIRGWLKKINDPNNLYQDNDLFSLGLNYDTPEGPSLYSYNTPQYNGNISHVYWKTDNISTDLKHYSYKYDELNRLIRAYYANNHAYNGKFNAYVYDYDLNGNIKRLYRSMQNPNNTNVGIGIDNLYYTYQGNKLMDVKDTNGTSTNGIEGFKDVNTVGDDFAYDTNGNLIEDKNKGITSITYNHLNLPTSIEVNNGSLFGTINYVYDANGMKLEKRIENLLGPDIITRYAGKFIYEEIGGPEELKFFNQPEGYIEPNGNGNFNYVYQFKDHLGNIRLSYRDLDNDGFITGSTSNVFYEDFESASGWDGSGASWGWPITGFDNNFKFEGSYSGKLDPRSPTENVSHSNEWITINNSQSTDYLISGWVYLEDVHGNSNDLYLMMKEAGETGYVTNTGYVRNSVRGKWVYMDKTITVPANIVEINFRIDNNGDGTVWFDNLSIRVVNGSNEIIQENNYYPFGLRHKDANNVISPNVNSLASKYKYNGQELDETLGVNLHEMKFRQYDATLGRFTSIDPLAELFGQRIKSPYSFASNNPINFNDPLGLCDGCDDFIKNYDGEWLDEVYLDFGNRESNVSSTEVDYDTPVYWESDYEGDLEDWNEEFDYDFDNHYDAYREYARVQRQIQIDKNIASIHQATGEAAQVIFTVATTIAPVPKIGLLKHLKFLKAPSLGITKVASSRVLHTTMKQLQKKYYKHAADFGVKGNWNKTAAGRFSSAINQHINSEGIRVINGTYKGQPAIHYLNPNTGLNVISKPNGQFWSGWKLGPQQLEGVLKNGTLW